MGNKTAGPAQLCAGFSSYARQWSGCGEIRWNFLASGQLMCHKIMAAHKIH